MMLQQYRAFVCCGRSQQLLAEKICDVLKQRGLRVFCQSDIDPFQRVIESMQDIIRNSTYLLVLVAEGDAPWQQDRWGAYTRFWMEVKCQQQGCLCTIPIITKLLTRDTLRRDAELFYSKSNVLDYEETDTFYDCLEAKLKGEDDIVQSG